MRNKKLIVFLLMTICLNFSCDNNSDCNLYKTLSKSEKDVQSIELINLKDKNKIHIDKSFFLDLKELKKIDGIWNFRKQFLIISYNNGLKDTITTDGTVFLYKDKYYRRNDKKNILHK
ncbi:hypothetical protein [Flavobacterium panacagri]|uniref:hypothetical protein n=1 Tax=Flavobacterium panacagri TaxID=3034146 RepID=UPI0025A57C7A|nr:hypothetical protein [Flavobacterium panacagri]